ncbi:MAG: glycosyltransferase family 1 protein [Zetaproteobacteria bacterium]|nr:MAG: glycosyltransferase family 1 protein [Zetaproteobacteria bacterium]
MAAVAEGLRLLLVADVSAEQVLGGAERMLNAHLRALLEAGHTVTLLTRQPDPDAPLRIALPCGIDEHRLPYDGDRGLRGFMQLRRAAGAWWRLRASHFDLVVAEQPFVAAALVAAGCRLPRLQVCHSLACEEYAGRYGLDGGLRARLAAAAMLWLERWIYRTADRVLALSVFTRERLRRMVGVAPEQVVIAPAGVSLPRRVRAAQRQAWRAQLGWEGPVVVTLRNLVPRTGVDLLVQTAAILRRSHPALRWCVIGAGPLQQPLRHLAGMLAVEEQIEWCGYLDEEQVAMRMAAADLFLLPTRSLEGFGLVTLEAAGFGLPVVATPVDANLEVVPELDDNRLAEAATPQALARAVGEALAAQQDEEYEARATRIRDQAQQRFPWQAHDAALLRAIAQIAAG